MKKMEHFERTEGCRTMVVLLNTLTYQKHQSASCREPCRALKKIDLKTIKGRDCYGDVGYIKGPPRRLRPQQLATGGR